MSDDDLADWLAARLDAAQGAVIVRIAEALGSTPRDTDAVMLVGVEDVVGTIGGGSLEWSAIERARDMLRAGAARENWSAPLGPALGQCCGGRVTLSFARASGETLATLRAEAERRRAMRPSVFVYGAGHVGRALSRALALLPVKTLLIDSRADELARADGPRRIADRPEETVREAPAGAAIVILTHSHTIDFLIAAAALERGDLAYVGMIGSATKRARFRSWLAASGRPLELANALVLPLGGAAVRDKRPQVIAALAAAELAVRLFSKPS